MPTYEYLCPEGHTFDVFQKMSDKPRTKCPKCGRMATRQISGGAGLVFKGSGFYITDYGKDGKGPRKEASSTSESSGSGEKSGGEKSGSEKSGTEKSATEKPSTAESSEKPAEKSPKAKSSSKKAKE